MIDCIRSRLIHLLAVALAVATVAGLSACGDNNECQGDQCDLTHDEQCNIPGDEDGDGMADCADTDCAGDPVCGTCGDGIQNVGEACDDHNQIDTDECTNTCNRARCGDGITHDGVEACDDGNTVDTDACTNACAAARCGDGIVRAGVEECDDGNQVNTDGCTNQCRIMFCGDGIQQPGEMCDDGNMVDNDGCTNTCTLPTCGDGIVQAPEECDDDNTDNNDGCLNTCLAARCGDGVIRTGMEACDDADTDAGDGCSATCTVESGFTCAMEPSQCATTCGDGVVAGAETCDQGGGNVTAGDGCSATCTIEANWTCTGMPSVCDTCGNGVVGPTEQCDDGNTVNVDGCSAQCRIEASEVEPNDDGTPTSGASGIGGNDFDVVGGVAVMNAHAQGAILASAGSTARIAKIDPIGDEDIFEIKNDTATTLELKVDIWSRAATYGVNVPCGSSIDTGLQVRLADGTVLASNDDRNGSADRCSGVTLALLPGATVYAQVVEYSDDGVINTPGYGLQVQFVPIVCGDNHQVAGVEECDDGNLVSGDGCSATCTVDIQCGAGQTPVVIDNTTMAAIPDNDQVTGVSSTIMVPTSGAVTTAKVFIGNITHTNDADLDIYLIAPNGLQRDVSTDNGSTGDNYVNTLIADSGSTAITSGSAPFSAGPYRPEQTLTSSISNDLTRTQAMGTWTLRVYDDLATNTGSLNRWRLLMCVDPANGYCGDGIVNGGEECDDGNNNNADNCSNTCAIADGCGDGNIDAGELCDDNNVAPGDGCSGTCQPDISCAAGEMAVVATNSTALVPPDGNNAGALSSIVINQAGLVRKAYVSVNVTHALDTHVDMWVMSPWGAQRELSTDRSGVNYRGTVFSDTATTAITSGTAPFTGQFKPIQTLGAFYGQSAAGEWVLRMADDTTGTTGQLDNWTLHLCIDPSVPKACGNGAVEAGESCDDNNTMVGDGCSDTCQIELSCAAGETALITTSADAKLLPQDSNTTGVTSTIAVVGAGNVTKAVVGIGNIGHTYDGDLDMTLIAPNASTVDVTSDNGGSGEDYLGTVLADAATALASAASAPMRGYFKPDAPLAPVAGQPAAGNWSLKVVDDSSGDTGIVRHWTLGLCVAP